MEHTKSTDQLLRIEQQDRVTIVRFGGQTRICSPNDIQRLGNELSDLIGTHSVTRLVLDFTGIQYMSAAGMGKLIQAKKGLRERDGSLALCHLNPGLVEVFRITRLDKTFLIYTTLEEALTVLV